ncbi:MAG TPA: FecR domain-containing protein [Tepidisphaeraceae bacterium]|nr:FecR domain-containing protein [Tepidisphaeraceae bacterium]
MRNPRIGRLSSLAAAAAIGFIAAILMVNSRHKSRLSLHPGYPATAALQPIAHLTLATGNVFTCPADQHDWREMGMHDAVAVGASVRTTPGSKCELQFSDGSCVRLDAGTEARFTADRAIRVKSGQVCSALAHDAAPLLLTVGTTNITAGPAPDSPRTRLDLQCTRDSANVCVQSGSAQVAAGESRAVVHAGQVLRAPWSPAVFACTPIPDPLLTAQWQDDLLLQKPADDPDLTARLDQLLKQIATDRKISDFPGTAEALVRAHGSAWCAALALWIRNHPHAASRQTAAGLLADLASADRIWDLIALLDDQDGHLRRDAAVALHRLTGQTLGFSPEHCMTARDPAVNAAWREWSQQMKKSE